MNAVEFIAKWKHAELKERSAAQEHFIDLCRLLGHPTPAEADPTGASFCFEKGGEKLGGGNGFADVWKKGFFGWEYKGAGKDLRSAYCQLLTYVKAIDNPPLLVVSDIESIIVHTNFTNAPTVTHTIPLDRMADPASLTVLHALFFDPEKLRPEITRDAITRDAAVRFAEVARSMRERGLDPVAVAHFLNRIVFCLFAEDTGLLPQGLFTRIVASAGNDLARLAKLLRQLFDAMAKGGDFGTEHIRYFNGSLFDSDDVLELTHSELRRIASAASLDWEEIDPTIFGTLFERGLDPATRAQLGAHFTGREDIESVVDAVVMPPLRRDWAETRQTVCNLLTYGKKSGVGSRLSEVGGRKSPESHCPISDSRPPTPDSRSSVSGSRLRKIRLEAESLTQAFLTRLQGVKVLDPACGSGNFLYVTLLRLKDLEKDVMVFSVENGLSPFLTLIGPWQLYGIELNPFAYDLAQMTVWIGWLQWRIRNGLNAPDEPVLKKLAGNFRNGDAILRRATDGQGAGEPEWPAVDFIVGNPPFLGDKMMRRELGDAYVNELRSLYEGRIPGQSDLCCYWFEKARAHIESGKCKRAGLLATQGIRGGANREVLNRIKKTGDIFWAVSDKDWVLDGANVHISIVAFDDGKEETKTLDRQSVKSINPNLSAGANTAGAARLKSNVGICYIGTTKKAPLDIDETTALQFLMEPNPNGKPSSDVIVPYLNADAITKRDPHTWIIDFPVNLSERECQGYASAFEYVRKLVYPLRQNHREPVQKKFWWRLARPCPDLLAKIQRLDRFLVTTIVSKYRLFVWRTVPTNPDHAVAAFISPDDFLFGVLHSRLHQVWSLTQGTQLEDRPRYTPTTCFETFPLPQPTADQEKAVADAARELNGLRERWLNPPEWTRVEVLEFPASVNGPWRRFIAASDGGAAASVRETDVGWTPRDLYEAERSVRLARDSAKAAVLLSQGIGTARYPRVAALNALCAKRLKKRTLTALYNERPAWLETAHRTLDAAVFAAYGWPSDLTDDAILERLLGLNRERSGRAMEECPHGHKTDAKRS